MRSTIKKIRNSLLIFIFALFRIDARPESRLKVPVYIPIDQSEFRWLEDLYRSMRVLTIGSQSEGHIVWATRVIQDRKHRYFAAAEKVSMALGKSVPWEVIAILHLMESSGDMSKQILNGEDYRYKTKKVPRGLGPWKTWEDSVIEAFQRRLIPSRWGIGETLDFLERWNGLGYRNRGLNSPYLWAYTNHQSRGKFTSDSVFNKDFVSLQVGAALILHELGY